MADLLNYGGSSASLAVVLLLKIVLCIPDVTAIASCTFPVQNCGDLSFSNLAEYVISSSSSQSTVCLTSNSSNYSLPLSAAAIRFIPALDNNTNADTQFCSSVPLDSSFVCSSRNSSTFPDQLTLFVSLEQLSKRERESIDFNITDGDGESSGQFSLNHATRGIYPLSGDTSASIILGKGVELQWLSYETDQLNYIYTDTDGNMPVQKPGNKSLTSWSPPCAMPTANESFNITPEVPKLVTVSIASSQFQDGGTYSITGEGGAESSIQLTIEEKGPPVLVTDGEQVLFKQINQQADIKCQIELYNTRPSWYFNNVPIVSDDSTYAIRKRSLRILTMTTERGGWYTCVASNVHGTTMKDILVVPADKPLIVTDNPLPSGTNYSVISGSTVVLPCLATGLPPPRIRWFAVNCMGTKEELLSVEGNVTIHAVTGTLILTNYTVEDERIFWCEADNVANSITMVTLGSPISVDVINGTNDSPSVPSQVHYSLSINETAILNCPSSSIASNVVWYQNGSILAHEQTTLTVTGNSNKSPEGVYCCLTNSSSLSLPVTQCYTVYMQLSATLSSNLINASVQANRSISYFVATETPNNLDQPVLNWLYQSYFINESSDGIDLFQNVQGESTLIINQADSSSTGLYSIEGSNSAGTYTTTSEIQVVDIGIDGGLLNSGGGEGVETEVMGHWGLVLGDGTASLSTPSSAETHFSLSPNSEVPRPSITQTITLDSLAGEMQALLSCRMRSSLPSSILPQVSLSVNTDPSSSNSLTLPYTTLDSWQWVTMVVNFTTDTNTNVIVSVTMETYEVNDASESVYFDDFCLQVLPLEASVTPSIPSSMPTESNHDNGLIHMKYLPFIYIGAGAVGIVVVLTCCMTLCYCCCYCCKRKRMKNKVKRQKSPLLNELEKSLEKSSDHKVEQNDYLALKNRKNEQEVLPNGSTEHQETCIDEVTEKRVVQLNKSVPQDIAYESQPVYVLPGETPIYVDSPNSNDTTLNEKDKTRVSVSYDYPGIIKSQQGPSQDDKGSSYDYARTFSLSLERNRNPAERKKSAPELVVVPVGNVRRLSERFDSLNEDREDSPEENEYDTCKLQIDPSKPWYNNNRDRAISMVSSTSGGGSQLKKNGNVERKWSDPGLDNVTADDDIYDNWDNNNYDNVEIDKNGVVLPSSYTGNSSSLLSPGSRQKIASSTSITQMPLPSLPACEQDIYTSPTIQFPSLNTPVDRSGYLTIQNANKSPEDENPYYKSLLTVDDNETYETPVQSPKPHSEEEDLYANDGLNKPHSKEEDPYANDGLEDIKNPSQDIYTSPDGDDPNYDYCTLTKIRHMPSKGQDASCVNASLDEDSSLLKDSDEPIYY